MTRAFGMIAGPLDADKFNKQAMFGRGPDLARAGECNPSLAGNVSLIDRSAARDTGVQVRCVDVWLHPPKRASPTANG